MSMVPQLSLAKTSSKLSSLQTANAQLSGSWHNLILMSAETTVWFLKQSLALNMKTLVVEAAKTALALIPM